MSLDVSLMDGEKCVFTWNITHNLCHMAEAAGLYQPMWNPYDIAADRTNIKAKELILSLAKGLEELLLEKDVYVKYNARNGWGVYENLVEAVVLYLTACIQHPEATVHISA